jgi:hypothetical protein
MEIGRVNCLGFVCEEIGLDLQTGCLQPGDARSRDPGVGIDRPNHHSRYPCLDHSIRAWRGVALMAAWLKRHVEGGVLGAVAGLLEGQDFGVGQSYPVMSPFADHLAGAIDDDSAYPRVGMSPMAGGELDGPSHVAGIAHSVARH